MRFLREQRIRSPKDFGIIKIEGKRESVGVFAVQMRVPALCPNNRGASLRRFGVIASRRVGIAVKRNRAKRIFRTIFRLNQGVLPESCDVILIVYSNFEKCDFNELQERYRSAILKIRQKVHDPVQ